ncbi:F-box protein CPR1-like [Rhododendron vialii]|uniref:F-box protein CPR1-like n=1 Tax=Rhododendron vialii TaxID=182163 RepID=UPI00265F75C9|nr:F-box protein CPR1-like [Rhododendron vialii]
MPSFVEARIIIDSCCESFYTSLFFDVAHAHAHPHKVAEDVDFKWGRVSRATRDLPIIHALKVLFPRNRNTCLLAIAFSRIVILCESPSLTVVVRNHHNIDSHPKAATAAMSDYETLPLEIPTDILSRLPIKSLCRLKCVSPTWKSLISSPDFAQAHLNRTNSQNPNTSLKIILVSTSHALYSVDFSDANPTAMKLDFPSAEQHSDKWVKVFSSSHGLLLVSDKSNSNLLLLNPSTRECRKLPPPIVLNTAHPGFYLLYGVGYDSSGKDYKVVMFCRYTTLTEFGVTRKVEVVLVYSLKTDAWEIIPDTHFTPANYSPRVSVNGCLHCVCWRTDDSLFIAAFDLSDKTFREVPLPASFHGSELSDCQLTVIGGCLCLVTHFHYATNVWMMKEYKVRESWIMFTIDRRMSPGRLWCSLSENEFLLRSDEHKLVVFNSEKETLRDMVVGGLPPEFTFGGTYVKNLVSLHHGGGIERE